MYTRLIHNQTRPVCYGGTGRQHPIPDGQRRYTGFFFLPSRVLVVDAGLENTQSRDERTERRPTDRFIRKLIHLSRNVGPKRTHFRRCFIGRISLGPRKNRIANFFIPLRAVFIHYVYFICVPRFTARVDTLSIASAVF